MLYYALLALNELNSVQEQAKLHQCSQASPAEMFLCFALVSIAILP